MSDRIKLINLHAQARELNALSEHRLVGSIYADTSEHGKYFIMTGAAYSLRQWDHFAGQFTSKVVYKSATKRGLFDAIQCAIDILTDNNRATVNNHWNDNHPQGGAL